MVTQAEALTKYGHGINIAGYAGYDDNPNGCWFAQGELWGDWTAANNFREEAVTYTLGQIRNVWGLKHIRLLVCWEWLVDGQAIPSIGRVCDIAKNLGMYVLIAPWINSDRSTMTPYCGITPDPATFGAQWGAIATALNKSNVVYELWNEPDDGGTTESMPALFEGYQAAINAIRQVNSNGIIVGWSYNLWGDINQPIDIEWKNALTLNWIWKFPLTDTANNLMYAFHNYENGFSENGQYVTTEAQIKKGYQMALVDKAHAEGKVLWNTEVGARWAQETAMRPWFHNTLSVTKSYVKCPITAFSGCQMGWLPYGMVSNGAWMSSPQESSWVAQEVQMFLSDNPPPDNGNLIWILLALAGLGAAIVLLSRSNIGGTSSGTALPAGSGQPNTTVAVIQPKAVPVQMKITPKPTVVSVTTS